MDNYKITMAYDGRRYKGWKATTRIEDDKTIEGKVTAVLSKLYETKVDVIGAVNTDAGVHAKNQVANFKAPTNEFNDKHLYNYLNEYLPEDIVVKYVEKVDERFQSKLLVESITYEYRLWKRDSKERALFERQYVNTMDKRLNVEKMRQGAERLVGKHDFAGFSSKCNKKSSTKTINEIEIKETDNELIIVVNANGFLFNMVRIIAGTLIQLGLNEREINSIDRALSTKNREDAGHKAMAHALCLTEVKY